MERGGRKRCALKSRPTSTSTSRGRRLLSRPSACHFGRTQCLPYMACPWCQIVKDLFVYHVSCCHLVVHIIALISLACARVSMILGNAFTYAFLLAFCSRFSVKVIAVRPANVWDILLRSKASNSSAGEEDDAKEGKRPLATLSTGGLA
ncbi:hypothetical protein PENSPDRAFT_53266 [Peniophora sp. CONT]|nr:hypothetical protein PENSPDRAFT_53266 [Peniophora sp. CONT]